jgi:hypothetical protein
VSETGQRLQITLPANTATYNGIYSNATFDLTGKSVQVEVAQTVSQAGWSENFIQVVLDANNYYLISVGSGSLVFRSMTGGVNNQTVISYDPSAFPYWRIRHDQAANKRRSDDVEVMAYSVLVASECANVPDRGCPGALRIGEVRNL